MLEIKNPYHILVNSLIEIRPSTFDKLLPVDQIRMMGMSAGFDEGATAYHKAVVKWLWEPCTEHPTRLYYNEQPVTKKTKPTWKNVNDEDWYYDHRYQCPSCMKNFKEGK